MDSFGNTIKKMREQKGLPLRTIAAYLDIDQAILSKIERGKRNANRAFVIKVAEYFKVNTNDLIISWLSDKLLYEVGNEDVALKALQVAEEKLEYKKLKEIGNTLILPILKQELEKFDSIRKAWLFGSFSRSDHNALSDLDITIETDSNFTYFDLAEVQHTLENALKVKVDIGFMDSFKPAIMKTVRADLKLIYER